MLLGMHIDVQIIEVLSGTNLKPKRMLKETNVSRDRSIIIYILNLNVL